MRGKIWETFTREHKSFVGECKVPQQKKSELGGQIIFQCFCFRPEKLFPTSEKLFFLPRNFCTLPSRFFFSRGTLVHFREIFVSLIESFVLFPETFCVLQSDICALFQVTFWFFRENTDFLWPNKKKNSNNGEMRGKILFRCTFVFVSERLRSRNKFCIHSLKFLENTNYWQAITKALKYNIFPTDSYFFHLHVPLRSCTSYLG